MGHFERSERKRAILKSIARLERALRKAQNKAEQQAIRAFIADARMRAARYGR